MQRVSRDSTGMPTPVRWLWRGSSVRMQVLFNYGPNYIATYCSPVGTSYLAQSTTAPGFNAPSNNPPQPVFPAPCHAWWQ